MEVWVVGVIIRVNTWSEFSSKKSLVKMKLLMVVLIGVKIMKQTGGYRSTRLSEN